MAALTLGLDLGPTSIGWALLDEANHWIVGCGVREFPEGVDRDTKGAELSKNAQRRLARAMRRQIRRRARRKQALRRILVSSGLLPECALAPADDPDRVAWERDAFKKSDPYTLRRRGVHGRLELFEIGRLLVHLNQRRGFKSNRKTDRARKKESSEILEMISDLAAKMGDQTLGEYLASLRPDDPKQHHTVRLRNLHTRRDMYEQEFAAVWAAQQRYHPAKLTSELKEAIRREIFFQRELLPPSPALVGRCELIRRLPRCARADRRAQRFRFYQEINNLSWIDMSTGEARAFRDPEHAELRQKLVAYLQVAKHRTFDQIRKHLFLQSESIRFNLEAGGRTKLQGMPTDAMLAHKSRFGRVWHNVPEETKDRIVSAIIDDEEQRLRHLLNEAGLDAERAPELLEKVDLEEGYVSYSIHAIKRLLPHIERSLPLTSRDPSIPCALRQAGFLMPWEHEVNQEPYLPEPPDVTNPIVRQALFEVRRVVNASLRELVYKQGHTLASVQIELAREMKGTAEQREKQSIENRARERDRDDAAERIREYGHRATRESINHYLLWKQQNEACVYCPPGRPKLGIVQLLGGEVHVDHVLPFSRSLDDSMMNKVVCCRDCNAAKRDKTPYEWLATTDSDRYDQVIQRARKLPYPKMKRFLVETVEVDEFFARQYVDTTYITSKVHEYVRCLCPDVVCLRGGHTATLRRLWGLNTVLRSDKQDLKNREDHRHHAIDAFVIALTSRRRLQELARLARRDQLDLPEAAYPAPWPDFRVDVARAVNDIKVSFRARRRVSGGLHRDTIYGPTEKPDEFAYRKRLDELTPSMVLKIRDEVIRGIVVERLREHGIEPERGAAKIPASVWKEPLCMPSGVPIRKVRLLVPSESIRPIRGGKAYVEPGNTHHVCLFELKDVNGRTTKDAVFVSMLEAMERVKNRQPIINRVHPHQPDARFLMSLSGYEMVMLGDDGREDLYRFETGASTSKQMWFRHHTYAGKSSDKRMQVSKKPNTFVGRKVSVDPLGRIRWAND